MFVTWLFRVKLVLYCFFFPTPCFHLKMNLDFYKKKYSASSMNPIFWDWPNLSPCTACHIPTLLPLSMDCTNIIATVKSALQIFGCTGQGLLLGVGLKFVPHS